MRNIFFALLVFCLGITTLHAQDAPEDKQNIEDVVNNKTGMLTANFQFDVTDTGVNSKQHEYGSGFFKQKYIIISAKKIGAIGGDKDPLTGEPHTQIYCATIKKTGDLDRPLLYSMILNTNDNEGTITFTPDERTVYYTRSLLGDKRNYQLYRARDAKGNGQWLGEEKIPFSSDDYSVENPWLNNKGDMLYFASDMPGGFGGFDIYSVVVNVDGTFGEPKNLGPNVNTEHDERTPFIDNDNKYLYFASAGHNSLGGLDVFRVRNAKSGFLGTLNLGTTINSDQDDYAFMLANKQRGYVTSAKSGGEGGSDVYKVTMKYFKQSLRGLVKDTLTDEIVPNATVELVDVNGDVVEKKTIGNDAKFSFYVDPYESYTIKTSKEGYNDNSMPFVADSGVERYFDVEVNLDQTAPQIVEEDGKKMIKIENIYFDFDKATIKEVSEMSLNKIVKVLEDNPEMKIEVNAHTDIRGTDSYNLNLSKRRAASTMKYLIQKGIDGRRLISEGYGESQPIIDCKSKDCTDEEHELNRRIEFVIVN